MKEKLKELQGLREQLDANKLIVKNKKEAFEKTIQEDVNQVATTIKSISNLQLELEPLALAEYAKTSLKKLTGGLGIRTTSKLSYKPADALRWAKEKSMFLILDKKNFEKSAKTMLDDLDFVTSSNINTVTFPKDLRLD